MPERRLGTGASTPRWEEVHEREGGLVAVDVRALRAACGVRLTVYVPGNLLGTGPDGVY